MTDDPHAQAQKLVQTLQAGGHPDHAGRIATLLSGNLAGEALLRALRETCDALLTAVEAIDPVSEMTLENLRLTIDRHLTPTKTPL